MNNGILDAVNLGWKLGLASTSGAPELLLHSYEQERRRAALEVLALTHLIFFGEASPHPVARFIRSRLLPYAAPLLPGLARQPRVAAAGVRLLAQPFVHYRHSPLSHDGTPRTTGWPRPGDRLPDQLVLAASGQARLHELTATPGIHVLLERDAPWDGAVLGTLPAGPRAHLHRLVDHDGEGVVGVRPDGYVGFRCGVVDRQLHAWLSLVGAQPS
jgi:hypothetical protein